MRFVQIFFLVSIFAIYQVLQVFLLPFIAVYLLLRKLKGKSVFGNLMQRIGMVPCVNNQERCFWIHAVSVGEILSIQQLICEIKIKFPKIPIYVTTGTITGKKIAEKRLGADYVSFLPYDFLLPIRIAFNRIKPRAIISVESEIWPNFLLTAYFKNIPMYLLNARIKKTSLFKFGLLKIFIAPLYKVFCHIFTQTEHDKKLFEQLGVIPSNVSNLGNIKAFNVVAKKQFECMVMPAMSEEVAGRRVLLVGSMHPGELDVFLRMFCALKREYTDLKIIIVPRHFHWKNNLVEKVAATGFPHFMWNETTDLLNYSKDLREDILTKVFNHHDILLVCTLGKLFNLYPLADLFYLGGTFVPVGGHNLLEPAVWGNPMFVGPYFQNTKEIADQLEKLGALIKLTKGQELIEFTRGLLDSNDTRKGMAKSALAWSMAESNRVSLNLNSLLKSLS